MKLTEPTRKAAPRVVLRRGWHELGRDLFEARTMDSSWSPAFAAVDRSRFLPPLMWPVDPAKRRPVRADRYAGRPRWQRYADADVPIVTKWDDNARSAIPVSVAPPPSLVMSMLRDLDVDPGARVLEVGTGVGWTAGLLAHRLGSESLVTVDVDRQVVTRAQRKLAEARLFPTVLERDLLEGDPIGAPYDRIIASRGLHTIPAAWIEQARPGGIILAPWRGVYGPHHGLVKLVVAEDGKSASGLFLRCTEVMDTRDLWSWPRHADYTARGWPTTIRQSATDRGPGDLIGPLSFILGLLRPDVAHTVRRHPKDGRLVIRFYSLTDRSWAQAAWIEDGGPGLVCQDGSRSLWHEVEEAVDRWISDGRPSIDRYGLTVDIHGIHTPWRDNPQHTPST
ncbi:methyltransferase domain-containing protein [Streptomyces sp. MAR4 CNX-425]|uniref:methyltransferase domain-containing protein n=1 Tax=Streptomyces sp. MAR4 CNX-425 TaxID=3406343 RepID=UPI003B4FFFC8